MKKKFNSIGKLLDKEDFTVADNGTVAISNDEMQKVEEHLAGLENSLASKDNDIATRDTRISELEEQVENLKKQPADDTKESVNTEDVADDYIKRSKEMFNDVKDMING